MQDKSSKPHRTIGRPRKEGVYLHCYIQKSVANDLDLLCAATGLSKTVAVEKALREFVSSFDTFNVRRI